MSAPPRSPHSVLVVVLTGVVVVTLIGIAALLFALRDSGGTSTGFSVDADDVSHGASEGPEGSEAGAIATAERLADVAMTADEATALTVADAPDAEWSRTEQGAVPAGERADRCLPTLEPAGAAYEATWTLAAPAAGGSATDRSDQVGRAVIRVEQFDTPAQASAAVAIRDTDAFRSCYLRALGDGATITDAERTSRPQPESVTLRTAIDRREGRRGCTVSEDAGWHQHGSVVVGSTYVARGAPFDPAAIALIDAAMGDRAER